MATVWTRVKRGDVVDPGLAGDEGIPEGVLADAVGCHDAEAGNDDATGFSHNSSFEELDGSTRSRCRARRRLP